MTGDAKGAQNTIAEDGQQTDKSSADHTVDTAIIGAGIAGLYCGYRIAKANEMLAADRQRTFRIFEESAHVGGRIWSTRIDPDGNGRPDGERVTGSVKDGLNYAGHPIEFVAEFGPMRIELELQKYLHCLLHDLKLTNDLQPFPPYESPMSKHDPQYELEDDERDQRTPLDLLMLAVLRIMGRVKSRCTDQEVPLSTEEPQEKKDRDLLETTLTALVNDLSRAIATRQSEWREILLKWVERLDEPDYQNIRRYGVFDDGNWTPLWEMGFWNLLSEVLSHHAVIKLRDLGTFYHLIPENPNAAEWLIFWLRAFRTSNQLVGIRGGMQRITETMEDSMTKDRLDRESKLVGITDAKDGAITLTFTKTEGGKAYAETWKAKHVILALPTGPLRELAKRSAAVLYQDLDRDLASVFGFPLLKFFVSVKERWWNVDATVANRYATLIPTRELHYWRSATPGSRKGLVMVYTDRPASTFWSNYIQHEPQSNGGRAPAPSEARESLIPSGFQSEPEIGPPKTNVRLVNKAIQYLKLYGLNRNRKGIEFYGIRDWGREPYLGAAHSWFPERRSWEVMKRLSAFAIGPGKHRTKPDHQEQATLHVCGEAYSDYQAFIEGALRSAAHVLHKIDPTAFPDTPTRWLCDGCDHSGAPRLPCDLDALNKDK
jgi:Flavin containing amine oxidoreductase